MVSQVTTEVAREAVHNFCERFNSIEKEYNDYIRQLASVTKYQALGRKQVAHQHHEVQELTNLVKSAPFASEERTDLLESLEDISIRLTEMKQHFPSESNGYFVLFCLLQKCSKRSTVSIYLDIILGQINVSILNKLERFRYKDDYEKFKLRVTIILCILAPLVCYFHLRVLDAAYNFFLVWYYCTLTIRERILKCNGSRIKGWWLFHHYVSAVLCGILLTWPDGDCYQNSRLQLLLLSFYMNIVQILQCQYQRGCLYRLRTLGRRHSMDITIEGFHSWMFRGLTFLLPFLVLGYIFQLYTAYSLYTDGQRLNCKEWQVDALSLIFFGIAVGNSLTTGSVCWQKVREKEEKERLHKKYRKIVDEDELADKY